MKRTIPLLITGFVGFLLIIVQFVPPLRELTEYAQRFFFVLTGFAIVLGSASLVHSHGTKLVKGRQGWGYSLIVIISFFGTLALGLFKIGVPPQYGIGTTLEQNGYIAQLRVTGTADDGRVFIAEVVGGEPGARLPLRVAGEEVATLTFDARGTAQLRLSTPLPPLTTADDFPPTPENPDAVPNLWLYQLYIPEVVLPPQIDPDDMPTFAPVDVALGDVLSGQLTTYGRLTGNYQWNGSPFMWVYNYIYLPLGATMFAMLAFYVASAAFRAFRARNAESVVLLLTAFLILLGRTSLGAYLTSGLPTEGFGSFFRIEVLTSWIMTTFNTAGNRAILIGIALGIASTSLKVLLGIDRSYLGAER